jgi:serine/threonine-protein kinase
LVKVLDFGVSKMVSAASQRLTRTGAVVGTVAYMAPEQMVDAKRVDARADIWSAGLMLYEALTRTHPFGALSKGAAVVTSIVNDPIAPVRTIRPEIPPELEAVVARMLEKSAGRRFASATEAAEALAPFAPLRSRPVLDEIRCAALPSGAAAPPARARADGLEAAASKRQAGRNTVRVLAIALLFVAAVIACVAVWKRFVGR